ncbi:MAG: NifB/NifX family molybdenum-iron cluster-binding protein [Pseudomonadota bacterium]
MKVAVSSTGKELGSTVDPRFGRAAYLVIVETDTMSIHEVVDNSQALSMAHGAGISAAARIAEAGAQAVLSGIVGPKAAAVCEKAGISMVNGASGTVQEAVEKFIGEYDLEPAGQGAATTATRPVRQRLGTGVQAGAGTGRCQGRGMGGGMGLGGGRRSGQCRNR